MGVARVGVVRLAVRGRLGEGVVLHQTAGLLLLRTRQQQQQVAAAAAAAVVAMQRVRMIV
jgi:hypothetical protein